MGSKYFTQEEIEQAKKIGLTYDALRHRLWKWRNKEKALTTPKRGERPLKDWDNEIYAMYKGEELLATGTVYEIAEEMGIKVVSAKLATYPSRHKRDKGRGRILVYIGRDDEEEII